MDFADLANDRLNDAACYFAAGEATRRTDFPVDLKVDERRWWLTINGKKARVLARRTAPKRPMRRAGNQDVTGADLLVFVDLSSSTPRFFITPPDVSSGQVEQHENQWARFADQTAAARTPGA